jgi:glycosyltransferase involved in cell wall biosynthesis
MAFQLLKGLQQDPDILLSVILLNRGRLLNLCSAHGITTFLVDEKKHSFLNIVNRVAAIAGKFEPGVIHSHRYKENMIAASAQVLCGMPRLVATQHGRMELLHLTSLQRVKNSVTNLRLNRRFDAVVAVSGDTRDYLMHECRVDAKKILTIFNGIETEKADTPSETNRKNKVIVGSAGRFFPVKNYTCMVDIAYEVLKHRPNVEFALAGDGPEKEVIRDKIQQYGLADRFKMHGHVNNMNAFYRNINIYINTSRHEGTPMTVLEAMSRGIPVLAFNHGGIKEIITDGTDGFLIPPGDMHLFAEKILKLAGDNDCLSEMGNNAFAKITSNYSSGKMVASYKLLYANVTNPIAV